MTAPIQLTIVLGHPLGMPPPTQASAPAAPNGPAQWTTAWRTDGGQQQQQPGPVSPPVIT